MEIKELTKAEEQLMQTQIQAVFCKAVVIIIHEFTAIIGAAQCRRGAVKGVIIDETKAYLPFVSIF